MYTSKEILWTLRTKFKFDDIKGKQADIYVKLELPGVKPVVTKVSNPKSTRSTVGKKLEGMMARQLRVETQYFREMIGCTRSCEDYYERLKSEQSATD